MVGCNAYLADSKRAVKNAKPNLVKSTFVKMTKSNTKGGTKSLTMRKVVK